MSDYSLYKLAVRGGGIANDAIGSSLWGVPSLVGQGIGLVDGPATEEELAAMDERPGLSYVPGVGGYRVVRKFMATHKAPGARKRIATNIAGTIAAPLLLALAGGAAGAGIGAAAAPDPTAKGRYAGVGGGVGAYLGLLTGIAAGGVGGMLGMARRRRTESEQAAADSKPASLGSILVPGLGAYSLARRFPRVQADEDERNRAYERRAQGNTPV